MNQTEKSNRSVDMIINAAIPEFASKGFDGAVLNDICRNNNISKGKLFHHFHGKGDLYIACCKRTAGDFAENNYSFVPNPAKTPQQNMHDYFLHRNAFYFKDICRMTLLLSIFKNENPAFKNELDKITNICRRANIATIRRIFNQSCSSLPEESFKAFVAAFFISQSYAILNAFYFISPCNMSESAIKRLLNETAETMDAIMDTILFGIYPRDGTCPERMPASGKIQFDVLFPYADKL